MSELILEDDHYCFGCGMDNPQGLRILWQVDGKSVTAEYVTEKKFQGWKDIVHGGILATLLDEAMTRLAWVACGGALSAEITVRYVAPAKIGEKLYIAARVIEENRKVVHLQSVVHAQRAAAPFLIARATGKAMKVKGVKA